MKLFAIKKNILLDVFLIKNFRNFKTIILTMLIFFQHYHGYSVVKSFSSPNEIASSKFKISNNSRKTLINQISISSVLNTTYCTGESGSIEFEANGFFFHKQYIFSSNF